MLPEDIIPVYLLEEASCHVRRACELRASAPSPSRVCNMAALGFSRFFSILPRPPPGGNGRAHSGVCIRHACARGPCAPARADPGATPRVHALLQPRAHGFLLQVLSSLPVDARWCRPRMRWCSHRARWRRWMRCSARCSRACPPRPCAASAAGTWCRRSACSRWPWGGALRGESLTCAPSGAAPRRCWMSSAACCSMSARRSRRRACTQTRACHVPLHRVSSQPPAASLTWPHGHTVLSIALVCRAPGSAAGVPAVMSGPVTTCAVHSSMSPESHASPPAALFAQSS